MLETSPKDSCSKKSYFTEWLRRAWRALAILMALLVLSAALWVSAIGQGWPPLAVLIYLPPLLGPSVILLLAVVDVFVIRRWQVLWVLPFLLLWAGPLLGYRFAKTATDVSHEGDLNLKLVTSNRGQHHGHQLTEFIRTHQPDVLGLDTRRRRTLPPGGDPAGVRSLGA